MSATMPAPPPEPEHKPSAGDRPDVRATVTDAGIDIVHDRWPVALEPGDWAPLLAFFGFDPTGYVVVDDTVKVAKWQTSKRLENGDRDVVWLYSYRARFAARPLDLTDPEDDARLLKAYARWRPSRSLPRKDNGAPVTYVHQQGDEQAGKNAAGGLEALSKRETDALQASVDRFRHLKRAGWHIEAIADIANGDRAENIAGHYASQPRTSATLRRQVRFGRGMDVARTAAFAEAGLPLVKAYTTSNHGELRPGLGLSPVTSESDNLDLMIAESVQDVVDCLPFADQVEWHIPHDEWWTLLRLSGVEAGVTHGHKAGRTLLTKWIRDQRDYLLFHHGWRLRLALLGHMHHGHLEDVSGTWLIQTPALEGASDPSTAQPDSWDLAGSPYFEASSGQRSQSGVLSFLAGLPLKGGWGEFTVL